MALGRHRRWLHTLHLSVWGGVQYMQEEPDMSQQGALCFFVGLAPTVLERFT
jgi:hypothetical protein